MKIRDAPGDDALVSRQQKLALVYNDRAIWEWDCTHQSSDTAAQGLTIERLRCCDVGRRRAGAVFVFAFAWSCKLGPWDHSLPEVRLWGERCCCLCCLEVCHG